MVLSREKPENPIQRLRRAGHPPPVENYLHRLKEAKRSEKNKIDEIEFILTWLHENEKLQRKFHVLESKLLSILSLQDFFEILLTEMSHIFQVPYVWLSVIKKSSLANLINPLIHSKIIIAKTQFLDRERFDEVFGENATPLLFSRNIHACEVFLPGSQKCQTGSLAIAPVQIDGEIVGSLNQWDPSPARFKPDMDTSLLEQLMMKVSLCLSNVAAHERLKYFAYHDPLTGLLNRRAFEALLRREFSLARRHLHELSLVFMDLDKFKHINDRYGHDAGDETLIYVAETVASLIRDEDIFARFAGDEFVLILPETPAAKAETLMKRIQAWLSAHPLHYHDIQLAVSLTYGIASMQDMDYHDAPALLKSADKALYAEKEKKAALKKNQKA